MHALNGRQCMYTRDSVYIYIHTFEKNFLATCMVLIMVTCMLVFEGVTFSGIKARIRFLWDMKT